MALVMRMMAGLTVWAAGFSALYALHGLGCALGWHQVALGYTTALGWVLIGTWGAFLGLALWLVTALRPAPPSFVNAIALAGALAGLGGLLFTGAPVVLPAHCL